MLPNRSMSPVGLAGSIKLHEWSLLREVWPNASSIVGIAFCSFWICEEDSAFPVAISKVLLPPQEHLRAGNTQNDFQNSRPVTQHAPG